jgi:hypothetical protein
MARAIFVGGKSGAGKSTSIRTLPREETLVINVNGKELPFKGGNKFITAKTDCYETINTLLQKVDKNKEQAGLRYVVIDDSQYLIVNQFMKNHSNLGKGNDIYSFYNILADSFWRLIYNIQTMRSDLTVIFLHHVETTESGYTKPKTIGKLLDEKVDIAGMFTIVLIAMREGKENFFITQNDGNSCAKSPMGMFTEERIPNDLLYVCETIDNFYKPEEV